MESSSDKEWASKYLLDPLNAPEPSQETGPGTHFGNTTKAPATNMSTVTPGTGSKKTATFHVESVPESSYPTPPQSASPRSSHPNSHRQEAFGTFSDTLPRRVASQREDSEQNASTSPSSHPAPTGRPRRASSLSQRYPGDMSHRPLDLIRKESLRAHRSRHLRKAQHSGSDSIDRLDDSVLGSYHHEGPYDAASMAKNRDPKAAPLGAVSGSNAEALKATPREKVSDSIRQHRPLDGTAFVPPGYPGPDGRIMQYEEGTDMMRFGGNEYKRWEGLTYHPDDLKGKSEPAYTIEKNLKDHKKATHRRVISENGAIEMTYRPNRTSSLDVAGSGSEASYRQWETDVRRSSSGSKGKDFVKRIGSLRHRHAHRAEEEPLTPKIETRIGSG